MLVGTSGSKASASILRFHLMEVGCWRQLYRYRSSVRLLTKSLEKQSIKLKGPQSIVRPSILMLSVFSTPCTNPILCHLATNRADLSTSSRNNPSYGSMSSPCSPGQHCFIRQSDKACSSFLFYLGSALWHCAESLQISKLPNRRKDGLMRSTTAACSIRMFPLQYGSRFTSYSHITRLPARVVGTPRLCIASDTRNSRRAELTTLLPSANRLNGLTPLPLSCSSKSWLCWLRQQPMRWALPSPSCPAQLPNWQPQQLLQIGQIIQESYAAAGKQFGAREILCRRKGILQKAVAVEVKQLQGRLGQASHVWIFPAFRSAPAKLIIGDCPWLVVDFLLDANSRLEDRTLEGHVMEGFKQVSAHPPKLQYKMSGGMYSGVGYMGSGGYGIEGAGMPSAATGHHRPDSGPPFFDYQPAFEAGRYQEAQSLPPQSHQPPPYDKFYESKPFNGGSGAVEQSPSITLLQRLSVLIKSQLPYLQSMSIGGGMDYRRPEDLYRRRSRSRSSRERERDRRGQPHQRRRSRSREGPQSNQPAGGFGGSGGNTAGGMDWLCPKCSFSNYEWRDRCKRCNESKATKSFMPGPEDWRCPKCNNINYARRLECNRCKAPRENK